MTGEEEFRLTSTSPRPNRRAPSVIAVRGKTPWHAPTVSSPRRCVSRALGFEGRLKRVVDFELLPPHPGKSKERFFPPAGSDPAYKTGAY